MEKSEDVANDERPSSPNASPELDAPELSISEINVQGWRRIVLLAAVFTGLFLSFLDTTIVSVALPTIANHFDAFGSSTWVLTAYLLTYMAFATIIARLSDIFGRRSVEIVCYVLFLGFSLGCGLSQSMLQLIIFRAMQGIGGSGLYSMTMVIALDAVPPSRRGILSAIIGCILAVSGVLGPVLSGAITHNRTASTWRWIFLLNLPVGGLGLAALLISWTRDTSRKSFTRKAFASIDYPGCLLLLAASVLVIFALQEGGAYVYAWSSSTIIACLVVSGVALLALLAWQIWLDRQPNLSIKQILPLPALKQRVVFATMIVTALSSFVYFIAIVSLPQRFQIVDRDSALIAGVRMIPMTISSAIGSFIAGALNSKKNLSTYTIVAAAALQLLGYGLLTTLGDGDSTPRSVYGFQVIIGMSFGMMVASITIFVQLQTKPAWKAAAQGMATQIRSFGGSLGLAIMVIVFNNGVRDSQALVSALTPSQADALYKSPLIISSLQPRQQELVAKVYAEAVTNEMWVATYISAASFVFAILTWQRHPPTPFDNAEEQITSASTSVTDAERGVRRGVNETNL